jgi:hypothetical protein
VREAAREVALQGEILRCDLRVRAQAATIQTVGGKGYDGFTVALVTQ